MPELPEVETVVRQFAPLLTGRVLRRLELFDPLLAPERPERVAGRRILAVRRIGKEIALRLSPLAGESRALWLCIHLRMTGRLLVENGSGPDPRMRARLVLDRGSVVFSDLRRFGTLKVTDSLKSIKTGGVDPLSRTLTARRLADLLAGSPQEIKIWLMRQDRLVGLGNIYCSEILYKAGIDPRRAAGLLTFEETRRLHHALRKILRQAIANCGTTFSDFQGANGEIGSYQAFLQVYNREGEACRACGTSIERVVQQQRSTFYCPSCQR